MKQVIGGSAVRAEEHRVPEVNVATHVRDRALEPRDPTYVRVV
jgi:hypothetical protein